MNGPPVVAYRHRRRPDSLLPWFLLVGQALSRAYLVFVLSLATFALAPMIFGMSATVVHGVSMRPHIVTGDIVLSIPYDKQSPVPMGRVVVFEAAPRSGHTGLIIHRIVAIQKDGLLVTKGDGDSDADLTPLAREDILSEGKVLIPWIGLPTIWLTQGDFLPLVLWIALTALAVLIEARGPVAGRGPPGEALLRRTAPMAAALLVAALLVSAVAVSQAMFTSRTSSVGNLWSYPPANPATKISFTTSPSGSTGGIAFSRQPVVTIKDAQGAVTTVSTLVLISLTTPGGATLSCPVNPRTSAQGIVAFTGCAVDRPGNYTLRATAGGLTATSASFVISVGPAAKLSFSVSPGSSAAGSSLAPQPIVDILDQGGNRVSASSFVTLTLTTPMGASLTCSSNPKRASSGTATFSGCAVSAAGTYTLTATSGSLTPATSSSFVVGPPALQCISLIWTATYSWSPTPYATTVYKLLINGVEVPATGASGWVSNVYLNNQNVPASLFPAGIATVEVRKVIAGGQEVVVGVGTVVLGSASNRTYLCS